MSATNGHENGARLKRSKNPGGAAGTGKSFTDVNGLERGASGLPKGVGDADYPISKAGCGRCIGKLRTGRRCGKYARRGEKTCERHGRRAVFHAKSSARYAEFFAKHPELEEAFHRYLEDPDLCDLSPELALQRMIMHTTLQLAERDPAGFHSETSISAIHQLNKSIVTLAEAVERIEAKRVNIITLPQLEWLLDLIVGTLADHEERPEVINNVAHALEEIALPTHLRSLAIAQRAPGRSSGDVPSLGEGSGESG